jgi:hypothetical protein
MLGHMVAQALSVGVVAVALLSSTEIKGVLGL